ncbi:MAG: YceD family protein [Bacillota bacterium]
MRLDVAQISQVKGASLSAEGTVDLPEELAPGLTTEGPAEVRVTVTNTGRFLHAEGRIDLRIRAACVRCLDQYELDLSIPLVEDYLEEMKTAPADAEKEFFLYSGTVLELDPAVATSVFLALPMKPLCREDCPGLCPHCGHNLKLGPCACLAEVDRPGPLD